MPFPNPDTQFKKGQSGFAGRHHNRPDIKALDELIKQIAAESKLAQTWLDHALGNPKKKIPPDFAYFKLLVQYRNGNVPQEVNLTHELSDEAKPRIEVPDVDSRPKRRANRRKAKAPGSNGDVSP